MNLKTALVAASVVLAVVTPASAHSWGGRGFGFFPFFPFVFVPPPPVYYYPPPYYAPPPTYQQPPPVYKDHAPLPPRHESSDDHIWRKQIISRIEENNLTVLNDGECYLLDYHVRSWTVGDEVLVTNDRSELINQSRNNEGAHIEMIGEKCVQ